VQTGKAIANRTCARCHNEPALHGSPFGQRCAGEIGAVVGQIGGAVTIGDVVAEVLVQNRRLASEETHRLGTPHAFWCGAQSGKLAQKGERPTCPTCAERR
jgi:hypothetical protein